MVRRALAAPLLLVWLSVCFAACGDDAPVTAPRSVRTPVVPATRTVNAFDEMHGEVVPDPYRWLEDDAGPEVVAWDEAQHALLRHHLDRSPHRERLAARLRAEYALPDLPTLPTFRGGQVWWMERTGGREHRCLFARPEGTDERNVVLDPNAWSADGTAIPTRRTRSRGCAPTRPTTTCSRRRIRRCT